jgi:hypothetical protein
MQFDVHVIGEWIAILLLHAPPRLLEGVVALPSALGAWPMPGGEGHGYVEEKQLCIPIRGHHDTAPAPAMSPLARGKRVWQARFKISLYQSFRRYPKEGF